MKDVKSTAAIIHLTKTIRKSGAAEKYVWVVSWLMSYEAITTRANKKKKKLIKQRGTMASVEQDDQEKKY